MPADSEQETKFRQKIRGWFPNSKVTRHRRIAETSDGGFKNYFMALELKNLCEKCGATLTPRSISYICSYECTYCASCAEGMKYVCPNCEGELLRRPR